MLGQIIVATADTPGCAPGNREWRKGETVNSDACHWLKVKQLKSFAKGLSNTHEVEQSEKVLTWSNAFSTSREKITEDPIRLVFA